MGMKNLPLAKVRMGDIEIEGRCVLAKNTIRVTTAEFGDLKFDAATGKALKGVAVITNLAELGISKTYLWVMEFGTLSNSGVLLTKIILTAENSQSFSGIVEETFAVSGHNKHRVGEVSRFTKVGWRSGAVKFHSRDEAVKHAAGELVQKAISHLESPEDWADGFTERGMFGTLVGSREILVAISSISREDPTVTKNHIKRLLIDGMVPTIQMVKPKKKGK